MMQLSPQAQQTLNDAVAEFAKETGFPLAFGGFQTGGVATVTSVFGHRTMSIPGLRVSTGRGLGGRAMTELRPRLTGDYSKSPHITHDYDKEILAEHVMALFAVPVILDGQVRALLYGGTRGGSIPRTSFISAGTRLAEDLAKEIRIEDEVTRRIAARASQDSALPSAVREELRAGHAELRRITSAVSDPGLKAQLLALEKRFSNVGTPEPTPLPSIKLSPRELDVLAHAALGATNVEIGQSLSLTESTVKSYLKSAMSKLDASTRHAAVASARKLALIP